MASRGRIPNGVYEGAPCIELYEADWLECEKDHEQLTRLCLSLLAPGIDFIRVGVDMPWGSQDLEYALGRLLSHPTFSGIHLWREIVHSDTRWSVLHAHTVMDCSDLVYATTNQESLAQSLRQIDQNVSEVFLWLEQPGVNPVVLDDLLSYLGAARGFIYTPDHLANEFLPAICKACTRWAVRT